MVVLGEVPFLMSEVPLYSGQVSHQCQSRDAALSEVMILTTLRFTGLTDLRLWA